MAPNPKRRDSKVEDAKVEKAPRLRKARTATAGATSPPKLGSNAKPHKAAASGDERGASVGDWRVAILADVRRLIHEVDADIVEERKWIKPSNPLGVPVWSYRGILCTGETYKQVVKLTFARGAVLKDPRQLFNASLEGNTRRAIDIREGDAIDAAGLQELIRAAVAENERSSAAKRDRKGSAGLLD